MRTPSLEEADGILSGGYNALPDGVLHEFCVGSQAEKLHDAIFVEFNGSR